MSARSCTRLTALSVVIASLLGCGRVNFDAQPSDAGMHDAGARDAGTRDAGAQDAGMPPAEPCPAVPLADLREEAVVGDGTAESCTEAALSDVLMGVPSAVRFDCGPSDVTIDVASPLELTNVVVDGDGRIALRSGVVGELFRGRGAVTLQRLALDGAGTAETALRMLDGEARLVEVDVRGFVDRAIATDADISLTVARSTFVGNPGGGLELRPTGELLVVDSVFRDNGADRFGGAIAALDGQTTVTVCGSLFQGNRARNGAAVFVNDFPEAGAVLRVSDSRFIGNQAGGTGGAVYAFRLSATVERCTFAENRSGDSGAGLWVQGPSATVESSLFFRNVSVGAGGGASLFAPARVANCTFFENLSTGATAVSGAVHSTDGMNLDMRNTLFVGNTTEGFEPHCLQTYDNDGGGNFQFPDRGARCVADIRTEDPGLVVGGAPEAPTVIPSPDSPAVGAGTMCEARDLTGAPRGEPCTSGAFELP